MKAVAAVADLFDHFRGGLTALIPVAERSGIVWRGPNVYDPWENIERTLFHSLVLSVVEYACDGPFLPAACYGLSYRDYTKLSFFSDHAAAQLGRTLVFVDLVTHDDPFDVARFMEIDASFMPIGALLTASSMNFDRSPFFIPRSARKLRTVVSVSLETHTVQRVDPSSGMSNL